MQFYACKPASHQAANISHDLQLTKNLQEFRMDDQSIYFTNFTEIAIVQFYLAQIIAAINSFYPMEMHKKIKPVQQILEHMDGGIYNHPSRNYIFMRSVMKVQVHY